MIRKFIKKLLGQDVAAPAPAPARIPLGRRVEVGAADHGIDPALLDERAVRVVRTLKDAGHEAYIVGGAVRDLLVGRRPKDFDVATDATPEQVKALFRRAFIIGRRFRIVHVVHGRGRDHEVIEVSTFRAYLDAQAGDAAIEGNEKTGKAELAGRHHAVDASGRVLRDNVFGPQIEDAARRDFTVNAMYYDPVSQVVVDYHGGLADVRARLLRMIGDPAARYREDPVRILRAVRFAAKLGFSFDESTRAPIRAMVPLLDNVPASRLFDEMVKLLQTGHALASVRELKAQGLAQVFPVLALLMRDDGDPSAARLIELALADTDLRVEEGRAVAPSFLLACLLWDEVRQRWSATRATGTPPFPALQEAIDAVFDARIGDISGRGKLAADMREVWMMQPRFEQRRGGNAAYALVEQPRFRAGYDFLRLRADAGEASAELADWWEDFALGSAEEREALLLAARERAPQRAPRAPRVVRARTGADAARADAGTPAHGADAGAVRADSGAAAARADAGVTSENGRDARDPGAGVEGVAPAARKRRRRRRKPAQGGAQASAPVSSDDAADAPG